MTTTPSFVPEPARGPGLASRRIARAAVPLLVLAAAFPLHAADTDEDFKTLVGRLQKEKPTFAKRQQDLLAQRYDLADKPAKGVTMSRGKPVQGGVRVKLPARA